ncbi:peptidoglycan-recognition protein SC2-like [Crassostrea angulata]|nr:peptidoglycan-recognition protein SC2-like [Crassostrea angulata]|eukprot:XP_011422763.2 PREDICTED: peptidoglycan-recognition protein SC2 [Crassostrea gigas]
MSRNCAYVIFVVIGHILELTMLIALFFSCIVVIPLVAGSDAPCHNIGGTCQDDHLHCSGSYATGLCSGDAHRRCCSSHTAVDIGGCSGVKIYSRDSWGARQPKSFSTFHTPASLFFIHHTAGHGCHDFDSCAHTLRGIQNYHMDTRGWNDIGYSFLVGQDGNVYEGRGWHHVGAHTQGYNSRGFAASFMGNFMTHLPNAASMNAVKALIACGVQKGYISPSYHLYGHRDVGSTECPGDQLYKEIQSWPHYSHTHP